MATSFKQIPKAKVPAEHKDAITPEQHFWRSFSSAFHKKQFGLVPCVEFSPVSSYEYAVASSMQVDIYNSRDGDHEIINSIKDFKEAVSCVSYRDDGKLLACGGAFKDVKMFDRDRTSMLRKFGGHTGTVHSVRFVDKTHLFSCSNDKTVRYWDIESGEAVFVLKGHTDMVRAGVVNPVSTNVLVTGSYDQHVNLWDIRTGKGVLRLNHGSPVESLVVTPDGTTMVSAGGNYLRVWDLLKGGQLREEVCHHQKAITSILYDKTNNRLISGGLDQAMRVYDPSTLESVFTTMFPSPILSMAVAPSGNSIIAGQSGSLSIIQRIPQATAPLPAPTRQANRGGVRFFLNSAAQSATIVRQEREKRPKFRPYEKAIQKMAYSQALDEVLKQGIPVLDLFTVVNELKHRKGLTRALAGRDDKSLLPLLQKLNAHITNPSYQANCIEIANAVLDVYSGVIIMSPILEDQITELRKRLGDLTEDDAEMMKTAGSLDFLVNSMISIIPVDMSVPTPLTPSDK